MSRKVLILTKSLIRDNCELKNTEKIKKYTINTVFFWLSL